MQRAAGYKTHGKYKITADADPKPNTHTIFSHKGSNGDVYIKIANADSNTSVTVHYKDKTADKTKQLAVVRPLSESVVHFNHDTTEGEFFLKTNKGSGEYWLEQYLRDNKNLLFLGFPCCPGANSDSELSGEKEE